MFVLAYPETMGNYEDMSPEHVVPLDPFLAGGAGGHHLSRSSNHNNTPLKVLELLPQFLLQMTATSIVTLAINWRPARLMHGRYTTNLWLLNRVLLI